MKVNFSPLSFGSFIPTRVMLDGKTVDGKTGDEIVKLFCENIRGGKSSQDTVSIQKQKESFAASVPGYRLHNQSITSGLVKNRDGAETRYILTGADARYWNDMGSLYNHRAEVGNPLNYEGKIIPEGQDSDAVNRLRGQAKAERQQSLNGMVEEHAFRNSLVISAKTLDPDGKTKRDRYEVEMINFFDNKNKGFDYTV